MKKCSRHTLVCTFLGLIGLTVCCSGAEAESALRDYVQAPEPGFSWEVKETRRVSGLQVHDLLLVSQEWKTGPWTHQLRVMMPEDRASDELGLLFIAGGSNSDGRPRWAGTNSDELRLLLRLAKRCRLPVAVVRQVPNQPLLNGRTEDQLISHTFKRYIDTRDASWPLLFPMVKSAVRAMDAVEEFTEAHTSGTVQEFIVAGASKRGWTTWLTASQDERVVGIAPMVIDMLNIPAQMDHQKAAWGDYSRMIRPYQATRVGGASLLQLIRSPKGQKLVSMVDPYAYRSSITVPKLIFIGTNDAYWPVDAARHYYPELRGPSTLHYVPNAGHGLGDRRRATRALVAFIDYVRRNQEPPKLSWKTRRSGNTLTIRGRASEPVQKAVLWVATSEDRDFRDETFVRRSCTSSGKQVSASVTRRREEFRAVFLDAVFEGPGGRSFRQCTRCFVLEPIGK